MRLQNLCFVIALSLLSTGAFSNLAAQTENVAPNSDLPQTFSATAIGQAGALGGKSFGVTVYVTGWTSNQDAHDFAVVLKKSGPDGLVSAMEKAKDVGRVAPTGSVGNGFRFARLRPGKAGGSKIIMVTDRPISLGEVYNASRTRDYPFGIVVLDLDKDGNGTGTLAPICKVKFNKKDELEIEHFGQKPFRLANVRKMK